MQPQNNRNMGMPEPVHIEFTEEVQQKLEAIKRSMAEKAEQETLRDTVEDEYTGK